MIECFGREYHEKNHSEIVFFNDAAHRPFFYATHRAIARGRPLLGIGSSFTNTTMLEAYGLSSVIYPGSVSYAILNIMGKCGNAVFENLPLLFAMGVSIGMAKKEKEVAGLSGAIAYLVMNTAISAMISAYGGVEAMHENSTASVLGITTLQMGVFGGIVVGMGVAGLHNRFYRIQLPTMLSSF